MTELAPRTAPPRLPDLRDPDAREHALNMTVYGLFLVSPLTLGLSALGGAVIAGTRRKGAGRVSRSHYRWQLWSFWATVGASLAGALWFALGATSSSATATTTRVGGDLAVLGMVLWGAALVGFLVASVYGLLRAGAHAPIGDPDAA